MDLHMEDQVTPERCEDCNELFVDDHFCLRKRYYHPDYSGVAWYIEGYNMIRDEDYEWSGIEYEDTTQVRAVMVGDDCTFIFETEDMVELEDGDYCHECGQIGCKGDFRE